MESKNKYKRKNSNAGKEKLNLIDDPRFSKLHYDPVFQNVPKNNSKVKIDSRFTGVFTGVFTGDKKFATSSSARVDKRGKAKQQSHNELRRYYSDEDEAETKYRKKKTTKTIESLNDHVEDDEEEKNIGEKFSESESESDKLLKSESSTSDDDTDDDDDDDDEIDASDLSEDDSSVEVENVAVIEKGTHRLVVVNIDWSQITAVDLFVMLRSFLPKGGKIKSVAVYPTEFGLKRIEEEAVRGPVALFEDEKKKDEGGVNSSEDEGESDDNEVIDDEEDTNEVSDNEDVDDVGDDEDLEEDDEHEEGMYSEDEDGDDVESDNDNVFDGNDDDEDEDDDEIDNEKLGAYEKSKLRYYFAVVECDSIATANCLYKVCDGIEVERSSNVLDLRFIPDSMEFKHQPRDVATEAPADYEGLDFQTRALQQSNVAPSWDEDEPHRVKTLRRIFPEKELAEMDLSEYFASFESESDDDQDKVNMYRALVLSGDGIEEEDEGQNMEVTFAMGLEDISKKILEKKEKGSETVFEANLRKKKEKKDDRKNRSKFLSDDDSDFFEEPTSAERSKKDKQRKKKQEEKAALEKQAELSKTELELLLTDQSGASKKPKGYKINQKKAKGKKGHETSDETNLPTVDVDDPRFSALLNNPGYALDPTDPQFKRSATYYWQLAKRQQQSSKEHDDVKPMESSMIHKEDKHSDDTWQKDKQELSAMIKSVKMKSQQLPVPSTGQRKDKIQSNGTTSGKKHKLPHSNRSTKKTKHHR